MTPEPQASRPFHLTAALYGRRTGPVRELSVVASSLALHTGHMAVVAGATAFVTRVMRRLAVSKKTARGRGQSSFGGGEEGGSVCASSFNWRLLRARSDPGVGPKTLSVGEPASPAPA
jgi:hypothetical protein